MQVVPQHPSWFAEHGIRKAHGWAWPDRGYAVVRNDLDRDELESVTAHEMKHLKDGSAFGEIGLIAEDVARIRPRMACRDENGKVVGYSRSSLIIPMLAEMTKMRDELDEQRKINRALLHRLDDVTKRIGTPEK